MALKLAVTPGEPAGIGPELLIQSVQQGCTHELVAFADPELLKQRASLPVQFKNLSLMMRVLLFPAIPNFSLKKPIPILL